MKLYKYCRAKAGIEIIRNSRVLLSNPSSFNDPFDSLLDISEEEIAKAKDLILNYEMFKGLYSTFHRADLKLSSSAEKVIINGLKKEFDICKRLMQKTNTYEGVPGLNHGLRRLSNLNPALKTKINKIYTDFEKNTVDPVKTLAKQVLVSCFSKIPNSILMWSHYADSNKGICIEIEEGRSEFKDVIYSKTRAKFELLNIIKRILAGDFLGKEDDLSDDEYYLKVLKPFFTKSLDWEYEKEVRCVLSNKPVPVDGFEISDNLPYFHVQITKIFIGLNTNEDDLNEILKLAWTRNIPVVYMEKHPTDFALVVNDQKKQKPIFASAPKHNPVELLFKEMEACLNDNHYISALIIGLSLPGIISSVIYPLLESKSGYIKVFEETYERFENQRQPRTPYICGELCFELKESLLNRGTAQIPHRIKDFEIDEIKFKVEKKKNLNIFITCLSRTTHIDGTISNQLDLNIREFCIRLSETCTDILKEHKEDFDKMPKMNIFDSDKEYEDMIECGIATKTINEQILNYARKKIIDKV